jgi:hypothetical protein
MSSGIPGDSNFRNLSSQLGGLRLNGIVSNQTAQSLNIVTIDDSAAAQQLTKTISGKFLQVTVGQNVYYLPLYS